MFYTVYQITNKINGKIYVGVHKTEDLNDGYIGSGFRLRQAIAKYGIDNFEKTILHYCSCAEEMFAVEKSIVDEDFVKRDDTYNIRIGGFGGWDHIDNRGRSFSVETRQRMSVGKKLTFLGEGNPFFGKSHSEQTKEKIGISSKARGAKMYEDRISSKDHPNVTIVTCPVCGKKGQHRAMFRWHFSNCKLAKV